MSRNLKIGIAVIVLGGLAVTILIVALIIANLGAIATWIGFDDALNLDGRQGAIGFVLHPGSARAKRDSMRG